MSKYDELYRKKNCDLCGKIAFEKHIGTKNILDGGFTRIEDFEPSGFGSMVIVFHELRDLKDSRVVLNLCPDCAREFDLGISKLLAELKKKYTIAEKERK